MYVGTFSKKKETLNRNANVLLLKRLLTAALRDLCRGENVIINNKDILVEDALRVNKVNKIPFNLEIR